MTKDHHFCQWIHVKYKRGCQVWAASFFYASKERKIFMQRIKEHIKTRQFTRCYLLYGEEDYLKKLYKHQLTTAILGSGGDIT